MYCQTIQSVNWQQQMSKFHKIWLGFDIILGSFHSTTRPAIVRGRFDFVSCAERRCQCIEIRVFVFRYTFKKRPCVQCAEQSENRLRASSQWRLSSAGIWMPRQGKTDAIPCRYIVGCAYAKLAQRTIFAAASPYNY